MTRLVLHHFPNACSQVTLFALDASQAEYEVRLINLREEQQASREYTEISPLGKVPVLMIDGVPLTENGALLTYLAEVYPEAALFPVDRTPLGLARRVSALCFCGATLHPIVRGILNPARMTDGDGGPVRSRSIALAQKNFAFAERQLGANGWWFGTMSVIDVYLNWVVTVARLGGFDVSAFPMLDGLRERLMAHPSFSRTIAKEIQFAASLGLPKKR